MNHVRLNEQSYRPQFSGHETFPLRYGWLKKAVDAVTNYPNKETNKAIFSRPEAIADFGVGKNMVLSIRHWATVTDIIIDLEDAFKIEIDDSDLLNTAKSGGEKAAKKVDVDATATQAGI